LAIVEFQTKLKETMNAVAVLVRVEPGFFERWLWQSKQVGDSIEKGFNWLVQMTPCIARFSSQLCLFTERI